MTPKTLGRALDLLLVCLLACAACNPPDPAPALPPDTQSDASARSTTRAEVPADAPLVVFLGDSLTAGLHLAQDQSFPAVLQQELAARGRSFRLVNAGVSGDTTAGGVRRLDWVLQRKPDVLVIELGANDGLRGVPLATIESNLTQIIERAQAQGARVLLLGMRLPLNYGSEYTAGFASLYERLAQQHAVASVPQFLDRVGGVAALNLEDGLHPNAQGHRILAENVLPHLRKLLEQVPH